MRNPVIDNIRGLCLLGVIGIHVGTLAAATQSFWLFSFFEILSRFSVPAFFFISGYGLFCRDEQLLALAQGVEKEDGFTYLPFLKKRLLSSGLPYLGWSYFYQLYFALTLGYVAWAPTEQFFLLVFGLSCYHLYFMVILIVFYLTAPLWRRFMAVLLRKGILAGMGLLFILQLGLYYISAHNNINPEAWAPWLKNLFVFRLNYIPLYYLFVYIAGGLVALYWEKIQSLLKSHALLGCLFFLASILYIQGSAYYSYNYEGYDLLSLANTYHQLSPQGLIYTLGSLVFFCIVLNHWQDKFSSTENCSSWYTKVERSSFHGIELLTHYSMLMYFLHPLFLDILTNKMTSYGIVPTVKKVTLVYVAVILLSLLGSILVQKLCQRNRYLRLLFMGR